MFFIFLLVDCVSSSGAPPGSPALPAAQGEGRGGDRTAEENKCGRLSRDVCSPKEALQRHFNEGLG